MNTALAYGIIGVFFLTIGGTQLLPTIMDVYKTMGVSTTFQLVKANSLLLLGIIFLTSAILIEFSKGKVWKE